MPSSYPTPSPTFSNNNSCNEQEQQQQEQQHSKNNSTSPKKDDDAVVAVVVGNKKKTTSTTATSSATASTSTSSTSSSTSAAVMVVSALPRLVADTTQLRHALEAFEYAHSSRLGRRPRRGDWAIRYYAYFLDAGIDTMNALLAGCKEDTINLDLDFIGVSPNERLDAVTIQYLINFLPGSVGIRCFRLAQMAAEKVRRGEADVKYVHRPENGQAGSEMWHVRHHSSNNATSSLMSRHNSFAFVNNHPSSSSSSSSSSSDETPPTTIIQPPQWTLHVDCAGFVRSVLKHITKDVVQVSLSDRSFMRAKDFYRFFETLDYSVTDKEELPVELDQRTERIKKWRLITDLRMVLPGDIIVYRPRGNAAGGAAFTTNDRSDLKHLLKAVQMAQLYRAELQVHGSQFLVTRNLGRDPSVKPFVDSNRLKFDTLGIQSCTQLREKLPVINTLLQAAGYNEPFDDVTLQLMKECCETQAKNTGHIVFAAGPAVLMKKSHNNSSTNSSPAGVYRIKVVHSTKNGVNQTEGVQQYYRRFQLVEGSHGGPKWTRIVEPESKPEKEEKTTTRDEDDDVKIIETRTLLAEDKQHCCTIPAASNKEICPVIEDDGDNDVHDANNNEDEDEEEDPNNTSMDADGALACDNNDDEDIDGDDPDDPEVNIKNEHDVPEENDSSSTTTTNNSNTISGNSSITNTSINALSIPSGNTHHDPYYHQHHHGNHDELAGLTNVEVLAARMCF